MLSALSAPTVQLSATIPTLKSEISFLHHGDCNDSTQNIQYDINISQMNQKNHSQMLSLSWNDVLERLINIVIDPVTKAISGHKHSCNSGLTKHCSHLLARIVAEMVHQYKGDVSTKKLILIMSSKFNILLN